MNDEYNSKGYTIIKGMLAPHLLYAFTRDLEQVVQAAAKQHGVTYSGLDSTIHKLDAIDHSIIGGIYDTISECDTMLAIVSDTDLRKKVAGCMGKPFGSPFYFMYHRCRIDPPQDERFTYGWHQQSYFSAFEASEVQLWCPLVRPSDRTMGTISVIEGSHHTELQHTIRQLTPDSHVEMMIPDDEVAGEPRFVEISPGDVLLFHPYLIHRSNSNVSNLIRYSLVATYVDVTDERFKYASKQAMREYHLRRCKNYEAFFHQHEREKTLAHV